MNEGLINKGSRKDTKLFNDNATSIEDTIKQAAAITEGEAFEMV